MSNPFLRIPGFCPDCGSILPPLRAEGGVSCYTCPRVFLEHAEEAFGPTKVERYIRFNSREAKEKSIKKENQSQDSNVDGPVVERMCPKCGNDKMAYATLQLRSADEGQTVFYTCTSCKYKERENS